MPGTLSHVAYVDDDIDILSIAKVALGTVGELETALIHGPQSAVEQLVRAAPDLILLDVMMPEIDGPTLLSDILHDPLLAKTPVIFMTAKVQPREVSHYLALGAIGVIPKPFDPMHLARDVRQLWDKWNDRESITAFVT